MNLKDPRTQLSYLLILIFLSASFFHKDILLLKNLAIATFSAVIFDFLFLKLRKIELFPPAAAITTGVIIALIMNPNLPAYEIVIASFLAILSKNFMRGENRHIFNPAGFGILLTCLIFRHSVSWWAVSFQQTLPFYLILLSPALVSMVRMKRFAIAVPFLIIYSLIQLITNHSSFITIPLDPTVLFFSLVMLPEPQTTPNKKTIQITFGIFVALISIASSRIFGMIDPLIFSLLIGNLLFYRLK